jgi:general secretion pathway protein K
MRLKKFIKPRSAPDRAPNNQGAILVITLLIIAALTALALAFSEESRVELNLAQFSRETLQARQMAAAGFNLVLTEIDKPDDVKIKEIEETKRDWSQFAPLAFPDPLPDGITVEARYLDESGKINLNYLYEQLKDKDKNKKAIEEIENQLKRLFSALGVNEESEDSPLVDCLEDWLDKDSDPTRLYGAEDDYYQGLPNPYPCANGPLLTIDQIFLIKGFAELKLNAETGEKKITDFLTIYSETNGGININAAPKEVLQSLGEDINADNAEAIIQYRQEHGEIKDEPTLKTILGSDAFGKIKVKIVYKNSNTGYLIEVNVKVQEAEVRLKAVAKQVKDKKNKEIVYWRII